MDVTSTLSFSLSLSHTLTHTLSGSQRVVESVGYGDDVLKV